VGTTQIRWADQRDQEAMFFALDDGAEAKDWESVHPEVRSAAHALTAALRSLCDIVTPISQV
jgi:hypothetical protein